MGIDHPLPLGRVGMARTNVLGLEMLHLGEDIVPITHFQLISLKRIEKFQISTISQLSIISLITGDSSSGVDTLSLSFLPF